MEQTTTAGPGAPLPPTLVFILGFLLGWMVDRFLPMGPGAGASFGLAAAGWVLAASGIALFAWGLTTFANVGTGIMLQQAATQVVHKGPYRWSRNPQYVAFTLIYIGMAWMAGLLWPIAFLPAVIVVLNAAVISREERYLRGTFGQDYDAYCQRVRRWV